MKEFEIKAQVRACQWDELSPEQQRLIAVAKEQTERSYCPYSHFHVGAAAELVGEEPEKHHHVRTNGVVEATEGVKNQ